jgi:hypothetical protein
MLTKKGPNTNGIKNRAPNEFDDVDINVIATIARNP